MADPLPGPRRNPAAFISGARSAMESATEHAELLTRLDHHSGEFALWRTIRGVRSGTHRSAGPEPAGEGAGVITAPIALPPGQPPA